MLFTLMELASNYSTGEYPTLLSLLRRSGMAPRKTHNLEKPVQIWPSLFARLGLKYALDARQSSRLGLKLSEPAFFLCFLPGNGPHRFHLSNYRAGPLTLPSGPALCYTGFVVEAVLDCESEATVGAFWRPRETLR